MLLEFIFLKIHKLSTIIHINYPQSTNITIYEYRLHRNKIIVTYFLYLYRRRLIVILFQVIQYHHTCKQKHYSKKKKTPQNVVLYIFSSTSVQQCKKHLLSPPRLTEHQQFTSPVSGKSVWGTTAACAVMCFSSSEMRSFHGLFCIEPHEKWLKMGRFIVPLRGEDYGDALCCIRGICNKVFPLPHNHWLGNGPLNRLPYFLYFLS